MRRFGLAGRERGLHLLVDAEYTYMNRGISAFALALMVAFNTVRIIRVIYLNNCVCPVPLCSTHT